jgi:flagellar biosynthesis GTPase FlhF
VPAYEVPAYEAPEAPVAEPDPFAAVSDAAPEPEPVLEPTPEPVAAAPRPVAGDPLPALAPEARDAATRLVERGLHPELAETVVEEAVQSLLPLDPGGDTLAAIREALARRIPVHPLRSGGGVVGFVGPGGAGKTRCVARLAAAHARHGALPVSVVSLRAQDGGAELTRLLAPYGVALHAVESGAEGAARIASLRGGLVILDTPGVSPRARGELKALAYELEALAPDELHLTVPATIAPAAARELIEGVRELGVAALTLTHADETEQLGTVVALSIASGLPLSYLARGQAVEAGLRSASPADLAEALLS